MGIEDLRHYARYAVYWAPPAGSALAKLGAGWLGYDAETGEEAPPLEVRGLPASRASLVRKARRYGFHATLKAPFRLGESASAEVLDIAVAALAARRRPVEAPGLRVDGELGFACLRPSGPSKDLDDLAAACVTELDLLRAPLTAAELSARRRDGLDMTEDQNLRAWGYPYVLSRFTFHVTLTIPLSRFELRDAEPALEDAFAPALTPRLRVDEIALYGDPGDNRPFRLLRRYPLGG
jgi:putative phosphonate metabolism protein